MSLHADDSAPTVGSSPRRATKAAVALLLIGLVVGGIGVARLLPDLQIDGDYATTAVGAPAYAALYTISGPVPGRTWLMIGGALALAGAALTAWSLARSRVRTTSVAPAAGRSRLGIGLTLAGVVVMTIGLTQVPNDTDDLGLFDDGPSIGRGDERPSLPVEIPGQREAQAGTLLMGLAGLALTFGLGDRQRGARARPAEPAQP